MGNTNVTLGNGIKVAVGDKVAVIVIGIAVGSVGAMSSNVGVISTVPSGPGVWILAKVAVIVAVIVAVAVAVSVVVMDWVAVGDPLCNKYRGFPAFGFPNASIVVPFISEE